MGNLIAQKYMVDIECSFRLVGEIMTDFGKIAGTMMFLLTDFSLIFTMHVMSRMLVLAQFGMGLT